MEQLTFKQWMMDTYSQDELSDIREYGCVNGVSGLIYYSETTAIYDKYCDELHEVLGNWIDSIGETPEFITKELGNATSFKNAVVWFVAELYAGEIYADTPDEELEF
jgi:hypothetical protein